MSCIKGTKCTDVLFIYLFILCSTRTLSLVPSTTNIVVRFFLLNLFYFLRPVSRIPHPASRIAIFGAIISPTFVTHSVCLFGRKLHIYTQLHITKASTAKVTCYFSEDFYSFSNFPREEKGGVGYYIDSIKELRQRWCSRTVVLIGVTCLTDVNGVTGGRNFIHILEC